MRLARSVPALLTAVLFSGSFVAARLTTVELEPLTTTLLRYAIASLLLTTLVLFRKADRRIRKEDRLRLVLLGLFGIVGYHTFFFVALRHTAVANTAILNSLSPIATGVAAAILLGERLSPTRVGGVVLAFVGVLLLLTRGSLQALTTLELRSGDGWMLVSVASWVAYSLLVKGLVERYSSLVLTWYASLAGVALLIPLSFTEPVLSQLAGLSTTALLSLLYMGLAASGLGYWLYNLSIERLGPTRTAAVVYSVVPLLVIPLAFLAFGEAVHPSMGLSGLVIVVGLNLTLRERTPARE